MLLKLIFYIVLLICSNYISCSRILFVYEIKGKPEHCFIVDPDSVLKNKTIKFLLPRPMMWTKEVLREEKLYIVGYIYSFVFYFPTQIACIVTFIIAFFNLELAATIFKIVFIVSIVGMALFGLWEILEYGYIFLKRKIEVRKKKKR